MANRVLALAVSAIALATSGGALELTIDNYDAFFKNPNMSVFVYYHGSECGDLCDKITPSWNALMRQYEREDFATENFKTASVNCSGAEKKLCNRIGISAFPTIKFGNPFNLEDYGGHRDLDSLQRFVVSNIQRRCDVGYLINNCGDAHMAVINKYMDMDVLELAKKIQVQSQSQGQVVDDFMEAEGKIKERATKLFREKEENVHNKKSSKELQLMQIVAAYVKAKRASTTPILTTQAEAEEAAEL